MPSVSLNRSLQKLRRSRQSLIVIHEENGSKTTSKGVPMRSGSSSSLLTASARGVRLRRRSFTVVLAAFFLLFVLYARESHTPSIFYEKFKYEVIHDWQIESGERERYSSKDGSDITKIIETKQRARIDIDKDETSADEERRKRNRERLAEAAKALRDRFNLHSDEEDKSGQKHRADLVPPEVLENSPDACAAALGTPKVALLFLIKDKIVHEDLWSVWFKSAVGMIPAEALNKTCSDGVPGGMNTAKSKMLSACSEYWPSHMQGHMNGTSSDDISGDSDSMKDPISMQHLFNVYVHAPPSADTKKIQPIWKQRLITHRVEPEWGTHTLVEATRNLAWEAFRDPSNQRFVLLSESDIPLYDPMTFYRQVMEENKSRVNAWLHDGVDYYRWKPAMAAFGDHGNIPKLLWRKSSQWFMLLRNHVEVFLNDEHLFRNMEENCWSGWDENAQVQRTCYSDEHYLPILLAMNGRRKETVNSLAGISATDWSRGGPHPYSYRPEDINKDLFRKKLRTSDECYDVDHNMAQHYALKTFVPLSQMFTERQTKMESSSTGVGLILEDGQVCSMLKDADTARAQYPIMKPTCSMNARKFTSETVINVLSVFANSCDEENSSFFGLRSSSLSLLSEEACMDAKAAVERLERGQQLRDFLLGNSSLS